MNRRTRQILAVVMVATALCADRATAAAPVRDASPGIVRSIAGRLTTSLRRVLPSPRLGPERRDEAVAAPAAVRIAHQPAAPSHASASGPFRFRLPPPAL